MSPCECICILNRVLWYYDAFYIRLYSYLNLRYVGIQKTSFTDQQLTSLSLPTPKLKFTIRKQNQQKHARQEQKNLILILRPQNRFGPLELVGLAWLDKSFFCYFWHVLYSKSLVIKILTYVFWTESSPFFNITSLQL